MSAEKTPLWIITVRALALSSPVLIFWGIMIGIVALPFVLPLLIGFLIGAAICWFGHWALVNLFVWFFDPEGHAAWKASDGDPFFDTLGEPLNFDSDDVRYTHAYPHEDDLDQC